MQMRQRNHGADMKHIAAIILATSVTATGAFAQSADWTGFYVGGSYSDTSDEDDLSNGGAFAYSLDYDGSGLGLFAGYNMQRGNLVYGAELAATPYTTGNPADHTGTRNHYFDFKGRLGYSAGSALIYGVLGYSTATTVESPGNVDIDTNGINYGVGVDYMVSDRFFMGVELLQRNLDGDYTTSGFPGWTFDGRSQSVSLRGGFKF